jgi:hypothetical protein
MERLPQNALCRADGAIGRKHAQYSMLIIPERLAVACRGAPVRCTWLELLPHAIGELQDRWSLSLGNPFDGSDGSCAWVAPAVRRDGTRAVLKLGMPHMEATHELQALRSNPTPT